MKGNSEQLGFGFDAMAEEQETAHLPSGVDEGIAAYRAMLEKNDAAMRAGDRCVCISLITKKRRFSRTFSVASTAR